MPEPLPSMSRKDRFSKYQDLESFSVHYDTILAENLRLLDQSYKAAEAALEFIAAKCVETSGNESGELNEAGAKLIGSIPAEIAQNEAFQKESSQKAQECALASHKFCSALGHPDPSKNVQLQLHETENVDLPDILEDFQRALTNYHASLYKNDMVYRTQIQPYENDRVQGTGVAGMPLFQDYSFEPRRKGDFMVMKLEKESKYLSEVLSMRTGRLRRRLQNEALAVEKREVEREARAWDERKKRLIGFLEGDLGGVLKEIERIEVGKAQRSRGNKGEESHERDRDRARNRDRERGRAGGIRDRGGMGGFGGGSGSGHQASKRRARGGGGGGGGRRDPKRKRRG